MAPGKCISFPVASAILLFKLLNNGIEVRITGAKAPRKPVAAAFGDHFAVSRHLELAGPAGNLRSINTQASLDHGHETRDFGIVVFSSRAMNDLNFHEVTGISFIRVSNAKQVYNAGCPLESPAGHPATCGPRGWPRLEPRQPL